MAALALRNRPSGVSSANSVTASWKAASRIFAVGGPASERSIS